MKRIDPNPAFPITDDAGDTYYGMSMRDYFAAHALQGILANHEREVEKQEDAAELAYTYADAMLDEREIKR